MNNANYGSQLQLQVTNTFAVQIDKTWSAQAARPYDPYLTPKGEEQVPLPPPTANCSTAQLLFDVISTFTMLSG